MKLPVLIVASLNTIQRLLKCSVAVFLVIHLLHFETIRLQPHHTRSTQSVSVAVFLVIHLLHFETIRLQPHDTRSTQSVSVAVCLLSVCLSLVSLSVSLVLPLNTQITSKTPYSIRCTKTFTDRCWELFLAQMNAVVTVHTTRQLQFARCLLIP